MRDLAAALERNVSPLVDLLARRDVAARLQAPSLFGCRLEAQHGERNAKLGRPTMRATSDFRLPDLVPLARDLAVAVAQAVDQHAGSADRELERAAALEAAVEADRNRIAFARPITARGQRDHRSL